MKNTTKADILKILVHLFQHVNCGTQLQIDRFNLHNLLESVVVNHLQDIKQMGPDFVFGLISFIEGETDPKCLYHIFKFLPAFIAEFDLGHLSEELFEVLSCYFPVDFNAVSIETSVVELYMFEPIVIVKSLIKLNIIHFRQPKMIQKFPGMI